MGMPNTLVEPRIVAFADWSEETAAEREWVWHGFLARGQITETTSLWKCGKSTLVGLFLRAMFTGQSEFLGLPLVRTPTLIISEEDLDQWRDRLGDLPRDTPLFAINRPFYLRPTAEQWAGYLGRLLPFIRSAGIGLLIVDPIANFISGNENDSGAMLDFLMPFTPLRNLGCAIWLQHHPRKADGTEGRAGRGSSALPAYVDILVEMRRKDGEAGSRVRTLRGYSRHKETPQSMLIELNLDGDGYRVLQSPADAQLSDMGRIVQSLLEQKRESMTVPEILSVWPKTALHPQVRSLHNLLKQHLGVFWKREGDGTRASQYRYIAIPKKQAEERVDTDQGVGGDDE